MFPDGNDNGGFELSDARTVEAAKYAKAYRAPNYRMGGGRMLDAVADLSALPCRGSYLDVGCGRGEMLLHALEIGFLHVQGVDVVPDLTDGDLVHLAYGHDLPFADGAFDVVSMFDVIEHLPAGDDEIVCREIGRVARKHVLLTANNRPSRLPTGEDLHINIRGYAEWDELFRQWFGGAEVTWIKTPREYVSEGWRIDL